jgi:GDP-L-fucose synthase
MKTHERLWLTGATGLVGSNLLHILNHRFPHLIIQGTSSKQVNLLNQEITENFVHEFKPDIAVLCAARVGGVLSNSRFPAVFSIENQLMQVNALNALINNGIKRIVFIGSSCIYPKDAPLPLNPRALYTGRLESSNRWYAVAKLAMISALEAISIERGVSTCTLLPTNLYGPNDNFHQEHGHVIPSLISKAYESKVSGKALKVWGDGSAYREILHVKDFCEAIVKVLEVKWSNVVLNVGSGEEFTISEIATSISGIAGLGVDPIFDPSKPSGVHRKNLDSSEIRGLGWQPKISLGEGLQQTWDWYVRNIQQIRKGSI